MTGKLELDLSKFTSIERCAGIQGGQAVFKGRRYRVSDLLNQLAKGYIDSVDAIAEDFDQDLDQITAFLQELAAQFEQAKTST